MYDLVQPGVTIRLSPGMRIYWSACEQAGAYIQIGGRYWIGLVPIETVRC